MFEVNLLLKFYQIPKDRKHDLEDDSSSGSFSESRDRVTYEISPNEYEFKNAMRDIVSGLETFVGKKKLSNEVKPKICFALRPNTKPSRSPNPAFILYISKF